ncbi:hypothetical protein LR48_Vigan04g169600 [Vigna angularis]|uniref:Uncharacterized protein n=1 Tax=Phaseolus angularis TaxID=3914 RepID=A0A0L9UFK0_PHAAN|nr:hypothetical protein LR48_Vigan04g169600 [Vigna angularis]
MRRRAPPKGRPCHTRHRRMFDRPSRYGLNLVRTNSPTPANVRRRAYGHPLEVSTPLDQEGSHSLRRRSTAESRSKENWKVENRTALHIRNSSLGRSHCMHIILGLKHRSSWENFLMGEGDGAHSIGLKHRSSRGNFLMVEGDEAHSLRLKHRSSQGNFPMAEGDEDHHLDLSIGVHGETSL